MYDYKDSKQRHEDITPKNKDPNHNIWFKQYDGNSLTPYSILNNRGCAYIIFHHNMKGSSFSKNMMIDDIFRGGGAIPKI